MSQSPTRTKLDTAQRGGQTHEVATTSSGGRPRRRPGRQTPNATQQLNLELLDRALDLFLENGFERTTIDAIASAVGMAKRTVYVRYGDKTGLFKAALRRAIESWIVPVERLRRAETDDVEESLLNVARILVANVINPAGLRLLRITNAESGRLPEIGAFSYTQGTAPTAAYLADLIRRRIQPNGSDAEQAAMAFLFLVVGGPANMTAWGLTLSEEEVDKYTRYAVRLFLHGLLHPDRKAGTQPMPRSSPSAVIKRSPSAQQGNTPLFVEDRAALENENRRLKLLLADSMLEIAALREAAARS